MNYPARFLLAVSLSVASGWGQFRVSIDLTSGGVTKNLFESAIRKELRSLKDVSISDESPTHRLRLLIYETQSRSGPDAGYALAYVFLSIFKVDLLPLLKGGADNKEKFRNSAIGSMFSVKETIDSFGMRHFGMNEVRTACEALVADFDSLSLEPSRKLNELVK